MADCSTTCNAGVGKIATMADCSATCSDPDAGVLEGMLPTGPVAMGPKPGIILPPPDTG